MAAHPKALVAKWMELPAGTLPSDVEIAYDPGRHQLLATERSGEATYLMTGGTWAKQSAAPLGDEVRALTYSPAIGEIVAVTLGRTPGCAPDQCQYTGITRASTWNGAAWSAPLTAPATAEPGRWVQADVMAVDPSNGNVIVLGGVYSPPCNPPLPGICYFGPRMWGFDGLTWTERQAPPDLQPCLAATHDPLLGVDYLLCNGTAWSFAGWSWQRLPDGSAPADRYVDRLAFDPSIGAVIGRESTATCRVPEDTWFWAGARATPVVERKIAGVCGSIAYDAELGGVVLAGEGRTFVMRAVLAS
jgi:hypothetical protein